MYADPEQPPANASSSKPFDAVALYDNTGTRLLNYRKVNLAAGESEFLQPGSVLGPVVELYGVKVVRLPAAEVAGVPHTSRLQ